MELIQAKLAECIELRKSEQLTIISNKKLFLPFLLNKVSFTLIYRSYYIIIRAKNKSLLSYKDITQVVLHPKIIENP